MVKASTQSLGPRWFDPDPGRHTEDQQERHFDIKMSTDLPPPTVHEPDKS